MKLFVATRAPNPRRVLLFIAEKGIDGIELVSVDLGAAEHFSADYRAKSPLSKVPALQLDDGRFLSESRAICSYLEGLHPLPNLMGDGFEERAFIEMADRQVELYLFGAIASCIRHTHPGLAALEQPPVCRLRPGAGRGARWRAGSTACWRRGPTSPGRASASPT